LGSFVSNMTKKRGFTVYREAEDIIFLVCTYLKRYKNIN